MRRSYRISVAMATYNGEKYIKEQLTSILNQLDCYDEVIISDDGSSDDTLEIIKNFHDCRIKVIEGPRKGLKQNFSNAIEHCHGRYIFLSDQDDIWESNKVNRVLQEFEKCHASVIVHDCVVVNNQMNIIEDSFYSLRKSKVGIKKNIWKNSYIGCCMAISSKLKDKILPIPDSIEMHDQWIGLIGEIYGKSVFISDKLIKYRRHDGNVSQLNQHHSFFKMVKNRLIFINEFIRKTNRIRHYMSALYYRIRILAHEILIRSKIMRLNNQYELKLVGEQVNYVSGSKTFRGKKDGQACILKGFDLFQLYMNEEKILKKLNSSYFPKIILSDKDFFIEEYIVGSTLDDYLTSHEITDEVIEKIIFQFVGCLDELYEQKIIHRDIRLDNIIICQVEDEVRIKIIDFGCAIDLENNWLKFPDRIERDLGEEYRNKRYCWDDAISILNILDSLNIDHHKFAKEIEKIKKRVGRINYERKS